MANQPFQACKTVKCPGIVKRPEYFCEKCKEDGTEKNSSKGKWKGKSGDPFYSSKEWRQDRRESLGKEPWCVCTAEYCPHHGQCNRLANVRDHKIPRSEGGEDFGENVQSLCKDCHNRKTANEDATGARGQQVFLVCGPAGSGKTSYVRKHLRESDLAWDFDAVARTISKYPYQLLPPHILRFVFALRDAFLKEAEKRTQDGIKRIWIIESAPLKERREFYRRVFKAKVIVLEVPTHECLRRIQEGHRRDQSFEWRAIVEKWWAQYTPTDGEQRITSNTESE